MDFRENSDGWSSTCQFLVRFPLYRLLDLCRVDGGRVCPSAEHSNEVASMVNNTRSADLTVFKCIDTGYLCWCRERKGARKVW